MSAQNTQLPECLSEAARRMQQLKVDCFELYFERQSSTQIEAKDQEVETFSSSQDVGLAVRVVKDRRLGFSFTTSLEREAVLKAVESALEIAKVMPVDEHVDLVPFGKREYPKPAAGSFDAEGLAVPTPEKIAMAKALETAARQKDSRIKAVRNSSIAEHASEIHLLDSEGRHLFERSTLYTAYLTCKAEQDGDSQMGGEFAFSTRLSGLDIAAIGSLAAGFATELLGAGAAPTMRCPAVFRNSVMAELIEFLADSFSAEQIDKGRSMLAGKHGQKLFSEHFTLIDHGQRPGGYATSSFDGEGIPRSRTMLVKQGIVAGTLYDAYHARKAGASPTGNAARGIKSPPSIAHTNLYIEPGSQTPEQLLQGISRGILITDLMGVHTANAVTGDFSLGASGILIENGHLTKPVRGFAVAGNVMEVFRRIVDTGNDLKFFGAIGAPSARISEISVGGT